MLFGPTIHSALATELKRLLVLISMGENSTYRKSHDAGKEVVKWRSGSDKVVVFVCTYKH
jgi:hypothetical protein